MAERAFPAPAARAPAPAERTSLASIDEYKVLVAQRILRENPALTFTHALPPMLPAIVVVNISVDHNGELVHAAVQRSRDNEASNIALAAVRHSAPFAKPLNLIGKRQKSLSFSETFLFNGQYQFQLRTLAGPQ